jgi:hypothetical protein
MLQWLATLLTRTWIHKCARETAALTFCTMDAVEAAYIPNRRSGLNVLSIGEDYGYLPVGPDSQNRICTITHIACPTHGISMLEALPYPQTTASVTQEATRNR